MRRHSDSPSRSVQTAAPDHVRDDKVLQIRLLEVNSHKIQCNGQVCEYRVHKIVVARAYRELLPHATFHRGFKPRYKNVVKTF